MQKQTGSPEVRMHPAGESIQEDGARWPIFEDPSDPRRFTVLTSAGYELLSKDRGARQEIRGLMNEYRAHERHEVGLGDIALGGTSGMRQKLGSGKDARVHAMGPYAVREVGKQVGFYDLLSELQRMNALSHVVEGGLPRWLSVPTHYAAHVDTETGRTYTVMDRVDGGLTVFDIVDYPHEDMPGYKKALVEATFGKRIGEAKEKVPELYGRAETALKEAILAAGKDPKDYLVDWEPWNVIVEPLYTPVGGSNYALAVIDQYQEVH